MTESGPRSALSLLSVARTCDLIRWRDATTACDLEPGYLLLNALVSLCVEIPLLLAAAILLLMAWPPLGA